MNLETLGQVSAIVAAVIALVGLPLIMLQLRVAGRQRQEAIKLSGSQVLLAVDAAPIAHHKINRDLRPGGGWYRSNEHPTDQKMPDVEPYLGVFERLWIAYSIGQIDIGTIKHLYEYRIGNIWANPRIVAAKLQNERLRAGWSMFIALTLALEGGDNLEGHTDPWQPPEWTDWEKHRRRRSCHR